MFIDSIDFDSIFKIGLGIFVLGVLIFSFVFKNCDTKRFRLAFLMAHSVLITLIGLIMYINRDEAQAGLIWLIPIYIDFAISWMFGFIKAISPLFEFKEVVLPFLFFIVVGGLQYYLVGMLCDFLVRYFKNRK